MSMMIQPAFEASPASPSQPGSDAQATEDGPSFFEVLTRSLLPDAEVDGKKMTKVAATARQLDKPPKDDKVDPEALLMGINLPVLLPEPRPDQRVAGGASTSPQHGLQALTHGLPFVSAAASGRALLAVNSAAHQAPGPVLSPGLEAPTNLQTEDLPALESLKTVLAKMVPVTAEAENAVPSAPAAVNALTAAVQTLTQDLRHMAPQGAQMSVSAGKAVASKLQAEPDLATVQARADQRFADVMARGTQPPNAGTHVQAGLHPQSGPPGRQVENETTLLQVTPAKADGQMLTAFEALAAEHNMPALPNAVGAMVSASFETGATGSAASAILRSHLAPEVGSQGWDQALSQHMVQMGKAGHQMTELQLNPPGLGPLKVTLDLNDHQMQLTFVSSHAAVRAAVEAAVPQLRATLADNGISLGNTSVSAESQAQNQAHSQAAFSQGQGRAPDHRAYADLPLRDKRVPMAQRVPPARRLGGGLAVDTYA